MKDQIRQVIREHGHLAVDVDTLADDADLYQAGMTSHAERQRDARAGGQPSTSSSPTRCSNASVFESVDSIAAALGRVRRGGVSTVAVSGDQALIEAARPDRRRGGRPDTPPTSTATPASRARRSTRCARPAPLSALRPRPSSAAAASRLEAVAQACFELGRRCSASAMVFAMHQIQVATIARHLEDAPGSRTISASSLAEQRLIASITSEVGTGGDMGRSVGRVTDARGRRAQLREAGPDRQLRRLRRRLPDHRCAAAPMPSPATR